jgi:hypothetical protein
LSAAISADIALNKKAGIAALNPPHKTCYHRPNNIGTLMTLSIIGAGFGRTGTASLKIALEMLGFGPCYHMSEVLTRRGHVGLWSDVAKGRPDWGAIFADYRATVDFPAANYWRALSAHYPKAKVILSVRDPDSWFQSTQETILSPRMIALARGTPWGEMVERTIHDFFDGKPHDRETLLRVFNAHNASVKAAFGPERLLVFEAREGWAPLCAFLGAPVPDAPYPRVNSKEEVEAMFAFIASPAGRRMMQGLGAAEDEGSVHDALFEGPSPAR